MAGALLALALLLGGGTPDAATQPTTPNGTAAGSAPARVSAAPIPAQAPDAAQPALTAAQCRVLAQALLDQRAEAVVRRDWPAFAGTIDPVASEFRQSQQAAFTSMGTVPFQAFTYEIIEIDPFDLPRPRRDILGAAAFTAKVIGHYRIADYDHAATSFESYLTFVPSGGRWYIASDADGTSAGYRTQPQLWDLGAVTVVHGERSIVLGIGETSRMERLATQADEAVTRVSTIWGSSWAGRVVVLAPDTQEHMAALLGTDEERYAQIAAITRADGARAGRAADRIVINPALWRRLGDNGQRIVMRHEVTHVATRSSNTAAMPLWLSEGFADYVGYGESGVPLPAAAEELFADIEAGAAPSGLPRDADFDPRAPDLAATYQQAWLAAVLIAVEYGEAELVDFYREVGTPDGSKAQNVDAAFGQVLDTTTMEFTAAWKAYLEEQAE